MTYNLALFRDQRKLHFKFLGQIVKWWRMKPVLSLSWEIIMSFQQFLLGIAVTVSIWNHSHFQFAFEPMSLVMSFVLPPVARYYQFILKIWIFPDRWQPQDSWLGSLASHNIDQKTISIRLWFRIYKPSKRHTLWREFVFSQLKLLKLFGRWRLGV